MVTSSISWSGSKFYGTFQNELEVLVLFHLLFSLLLEPPASHKVSVFDESESAEIWGKGKFKEGCIEKEKWNLRICLSWKTANINWLIEKKHPHFLCSLGICHFPSLFVSHWASILVPYLNPLKRNFPLEEVIMKYMKSLVDHILASKEHIILEKKDLYVANMCQTYLYVNVYMLPRLKFVSWLSCALKYCKVC